MDILLFYIFLVEVQTISINNKQWWVPIKEKMYWNTHILNISLSRTLRYRKGESCFFLLFRTFSELLYRGGLQKYCNGFLSVWYGVKILSFKTYLDFCVKKKYTAPSQDSRVVREAQQIILKGAHPL